MIRTTPFALVLALAAAAPASAQPLETFGIKLSLTASTIRTDLPSEDPETRHGGGGVLYAQWNGPGRASLVTEAGYLERGYSRWQSAYPDVMDPYAHRLDKRMQYVSVATLAKVPVAGTGAASAYVIAGPRMNALVGRRGEDVPGYDYRPVVWDGTAGVGLEMRGLPVLAEARYSRGFNDALSGDGWRGTAYHRALDIMVGVRF
jgi:hypothetical protein